MFSKFPSSLYQRKRKMKGLSSEKIGLSNFKCWIKNTIFGYFRYILRFESAKTIVIFQISSLAFNNSHSQSFMKKEKKLSLRSNAPFLSSSGLQFCKNIVIFKIKTLKFFKMQSFMQNKKL